MKRPDEFVASHPFELTVLVGALRTAIDYGYESHGGIVQELLDRAVCAARAADEKDRANQLAGGRAAND